MQGSKEAGRQGNSSLAPRGANGTPATAGKLEAEAEPLTPSEPTKICTLFDTYAGVGINLAQFGTTRSYF